MPALGAACVGSGEVGGAAAEKSPDCWGPGRLSHQRTLPQEAAGAVPGPSAARRGFGDGEAASYRGAAAAERLPGVPDVLHWFVPTARSSHPPGTATWLRLYPPQISAGVGKGPGTVAVGGLGEGKVPKTPWGDVVSYGRRQCHGSAASCRGAVLRPELGGVGGDGGRSVSGRWFWHLMTFCGWWMEQGRGKHI